MSRTFTLLMSGVFAAATLVHALSPTALVKGEQAGRITVIDGARILDGNGGAPIENGRLVIENGRISAVGAQSAVAMPAGATRIDAAGKTTTAGMSKGDKQNGG